MRKVIIVLLAALALFLAGCVLYDYRTGALLPNSEKLGVKDFSVGVSGPDPCKEVDSPTPCYCMYCQNDTNWIESLFPILSKWFDTNLESGRCKFDHCNATTFIDSVLHPTDGYQPRVFMVGNGPGFASTDRANRYCNYSLQLATKWMIAKNNTPPKVPMPARAGCWLERNVIPVYIYYSGGRTIDYSRTRDIALKFNDDDTGPVMITTEIAFNSSNQSQVAAVRQQIDAINSSCEKCLTVLALQPGDKLALEEILGPSGGVWQNPRNVSLQYDKVDLVGFGFRANDYPACDVDQIIASNIAFSRFVLRNYSKPTIWLYAGASEGPNFDASCNFSDVNVHNFYQNIFMLSQILASSGVVGMSFYEFTDRTGPLPCNGVQGCDFGLMLANSSQKHPEINTWSNLCQFFGNEEYRSPLIFSRNSYGTSCNFAQNFKMFAAVSAETNTRLGLKYDEVPSLDKVAKLNCGEVCVSETKLSSDSAQIYDSPTGLSNAHFSTGNDHCTRYPIIEELADSEDISSTFIRSIIEHESSFNPSLPSFCVPLARPCNKWRPTTQNDPRNYYYMSEICDAAGISPADCPQECPQGKKRCAFGLMQCIELPGQLYVQDDIAMPPVVQECGGANYNPFNPDMSICCGIKKFANEKLPAAESWVNSHWHQINTNVCPGGVKDEDRGWLTYYLAANNYFGLSPPSIQGFLNQRDANNNTCGGQQNYIRYIRNLQNPNPDEGAGYSFGAEVISIYTEAVEECDSDCPGK